jgi:hypothetical protein
MAGHQIEAIYEYLGAIPCIDNTFSTPPAGAPNELKTIAETILRSVVKLVIRLRVVVQSRNAL